MSNSLIKVEPRLSKAASALIDIAINEMLKAYEPAPSVTEASYTPTTDELYKKVICFCDTENSQLFSAYQFAQKLIGLNIPYQWVINENKNTICWLLKKRS